MSAWAWPQWVYAGLLSYGVLRAMVKHGEPSPPWDAGFSMAAAMLCAWLLWMGGFWG